MDKKERKIKENISVNSGNYGLPVTAEGRETTEIPNHIMYLTG